MPSLRRFSVLFALAALLACGAEGAPAVATRQPGFRLPSIEGRKIGPADFRGKVVVADFWATWCGPCVLQAEILHRAQALYEKKDVQFLAIDVGEDAKTVRAYLAKRPIPYPVLLDEEEKVSGDLGVVGFPTLLIIDRQGEISYLRVGIVPDKRLRELLTKAGAPLPSAAPTPTPPPSRPATSASGD